MARKQVSKQEKTPTFRYIARTSRGEMVEGTVTAEAEAVAARKLQGMGLAPLSVKRQTAGSQLAGVKIGKGKRVKAKHLAIFARQFATMTDAGLPIVSIVQALGNQTEHPRLKEILPAIQTDIEAGKPLSVALSKFPLEFPPLMVGMVAAGEVSGALTLALNTVAETYTKEARLRSKTIAALLYPGIVLSMAVIMVIGMLLFVVPRFKVIFEQLGGQLPLPTKILVFVSNQMAYIVPIVIVGAIIFLIWWRRNKNSRRVREFVDPMKLRIPILGKFFQKISLARFSRTLSSLLRSGVPMIQTLEITGATSGNIVIADALNDISRSVASGSTIAEPMEEHPIFPPLIQQMVATGEETGALAELLTKAAEYYEDEVETASEALSATLEPVMIIMLAVIIGGVVISLYLPMFKVFDLIK